MARAEANPIAELAGLIESRQREEGMGWDDPIHCVFSYGGVKYDRIIMKCDESKSSVESFKIYFRIVADCHDHRNCVDPTDCKVVAHGNTFNHAIEDLCCRIDHTKVCPRCRALVQKTEIKRGKCIHCLLTECMSQFGPDKFECFVCSDETPWDDRRKYCFQEHSDVMCKGCYEKVDRCPICRGRKYVG